MATKKITLNELRSIVKQIIKENKDLINENLDSESSISEFLNIINDDSINIGPIGGEHSIVKKYDKKNNIVYGEFDFTYHRAGDDGETIIEDVPFEAKIIQEEDRFLPPGSAPDEWVTKKHYTLNISVAGKELFNLLKTTNKKDGGKTFRSIRDEIVNSVTHFIRIKTNNKQFKFRI